jgi:hypothetical protein
MAAWAAIHSGAHLCTMAVVYTKVPANFIRDAYFLK